MGTKYEKSAPGETVSEVKEQSSNHERRWAAVVAVGLSVFLSALDATIVALALPPIASHFQLSDSAVSVVTLSYAVPLTLLVLPSGALLNRYRSLPIFLISVIGFGLGSIVSGFAPSFPFLLTGRAIQGSFGALIGTQGFALAAAIVSPKERGRAMGIVGTIAPIGGVAGPGIGGLLLASFGWSSVFFVNVPVCLVASLLGIYSLRGFRLGSQGAGSNNTYHQMRGLLHETKFLTSLLAFFFSVSASVALYYVLPFDLGGIEHISSVLSGTVLLCVPFGMMVMGILGGYLTDRYGAARFIIIGSSLLLLGSIMLSLVVTARTTELDLVWHLLLIGGDIGLFSSANQTVVMSVGGRETMGAASALSNLSARLGNVFSPFVIGIAWSFLGSFSAQIMFGMLMVDYLASVTLFLALFSLKKG